MHRTIEMICLGLPMDDSIFKVGVEDVTEIKDMSVEFDSGIYCCYHIYKGKYLHEMWENVPVMITYKK